MCPFWCLLRPQLLARWWVIVAGLVLLTFATRLPALLHPRAIDDEAIYSVVANEIVAGGAPYRDAVERKPPLLFWTYAAVFQVGGVYNWPALHLVAVLWTLGTIAGVYAIAARLWDQTAGLWAAFLFSVFASFATWKNLAFNGEMLMNLPLVWAWRFGLGERTSRWRPELLLAGILLAAACLLKQPAAIAALPLGVYLLIPTNRGYSRALGHAAQLTLGYVLALALVACSLFRQGVLREAIYWTVFDHSVPHVFWHRAGSTTAMFCLSCGPLLFATAWSITRRSGRWHDRKREHLAIMGWLLVSVIGVAAGGRFYPHYYLQLLPALTLLAVPYFLQGRTRIWMKTWLLAVVLLFLVLHWSGLRSQRDASTAARFLQSHSTMADRSFVWGQRPDIYLDAHRRPASRYVATFPLTGYVFGGPVPGLDTDARIVPGAWEQWHEEMEAHPPAYIIDTEAEPSALYPVAKFPRLSDMLARDYREVSRMPDTVIYQRIAVSSWRG